MFKIKKDIYQTIYLWANIAYKISNITTQTTEHKKL